MMHKKILKILLLMAVLSVSIGAILNHVVRSVNRGMPSIGLTSAFGKYVPINQGTKLVFLADVIRVGSYILSVGDLFFFTGIFICLIALWVTLPPGRKFSHTNCQHYRDFYVGSSSKYAINRIM